MKRDFFIAIIIGFVAGAIVATTILNFPLLLSLVNKNDTSNSTVTQISSTPSPASAITLEISDPQDNSIAPTKNVTVKGKTQPENFIVIDTDSFQDVTPASSDGTFSFPISLNLGGNDITLTAYNKNGESESKILTVLYQDEKL
jgi:hypothetical protein